MVEALARVQGQVEVAPAGEQIGGGLLGGQVRLETERGQQAGQRPDGAMGDHGGPP